MYHIKTSELIKTTKVMKVQQWFIMVTINTREIYVSGNSRNPCT